MVQQLTLNIQLNERIRFANFVVGDNAEVLSTLQSLWQADEFCYYVWGELGVGRTHLLQASCHEADQSGKTLFYIPLAAAETLSPMILQGIDAFDLVVWDDVDAIAGNAEWEEALFHAYNLLQAVGRKLLVSANCSAMLNPIHLLDLRTRLASGVSYHLKPLSDKQKLIALQQRAHEHGMMLTDQVGRYLLSHYSREMSALFEMLAQLEAATLQAKRKLTIPLVKETLHQGADRPLIEN